MADDECAWYGTPLRKSLTSGGFALAAVFRAWQDAGVLRVCELPRFTGQCRPRGTCQQVRLMRLGMTYPGKQMDLD